MGPIRDDAVPERLSGVAPPFLHEGATRTLSPGSRTPLPSEEPALGDGSTVSPWGSTEHARTGISTPPDWQQPFLSVTVTESETVPDAPEVNRMTLVPAPAVIVPLT